jgi:CheY-like chemotaxis protein
MLAFRPMTKSEKPCVLFIDDNEATCTLVTALLRRDFDVETAFDGNDAIENLKTRRYAAILLDLQMPRVDGFAVLDHLKQHSPDLLRSVLIVTASVRALELDRAREYDIFGIVTKPFEVELLLSVVKQCVGSPDGGRLGNVFATGGPVILLLADLLRQRFM